VAAHAQVAPVETVTLPLPPASAKSSVAGVME